MVNDGKNKQIAIAAGGTGGHLFPALALAQIMLQSGYKIFFITDKNFFKFKEQFNIIINNKNFSLYCLKIKRRNGTIGRFKMAVESLLAIFAVARYCVTNKIKGVVGFGSYVSLPSVIGGFLVGKKTIIHEQNKVLGLSNKISSWFVSVCACGFPETKGFHWLNIKKAVFVGNPVREEFTKLHTIKTNNERQGNFYESALMFKTVNSINILIIGGSQGASVFKDIVSPALCKLPLKIRRKLKVYQQVTEGQKNEVKQLFDKFGIRCVVETFFNNVSELMSSAHLFIGRAGASTIAEIECIGVPSVIIPYPEAANDHQTQNALFLQQNGGAIVINQNGVTVRKLLKTIETILSSEQELLSISEKTKKLAEPFAATKMAIIVETVIFGHSALFVSNYKTGIISDSGLKVRQ
ncbi:MAG: UDP-N-acetylglucosamine--N-acetylmuramyl-(pentapeptide) pyrophosphoryl-undecaprenol N-acetylglucosamine transferase [Alphaproteobacteria bacterium]|nr:UDP-N-acetylglucosamine--N-acetylmuramyl-(pentapeptide) pyrophosphoryl-undecaprenol N-acetylglucosamine transferase [Rickettsiales bacterium]